MKPKYPASLRVRITERQKEQLQAKAMLAGLDLSDIVRMAIVRYLAGGENAQAHPAK